MAKTYTSTIQIDCWKEHTCAACGSVYSYHFKRTARGQAGNADKATQNARANATKIMERDVDLQPCPGCGLYQPDMIGQTRAKRHKVVFWLMIVAAIVLLVLRGTDVLRADTATWAAVGLCALAALLHFS